MERVIANGSNFMCFEVTGPQGTEVYRPIEGQTACTLTREPNYRETNNKNLGGSKDFFQGLKGWGATIEMDVADPADVEATEVSQEELDDWENEGTKTDFFFCYVTPPATSDLAATPDLTKPNWRGVGLINSPINSPSGENITSSVAIQGCRNLIKTAGTP